MDNEESRRKAWQRAFTNTKLEYPNWQPNEEYLELIKKCIKGGMTINDVESILIEKYKED